MIKIKSIVSIPTDYFNTHIEVNGKTKRPDGTPTDITDLIDARNNAIYQKLIERGIKKNRIVKRTGWMKKNGETPTTDFVIYEKPN